MSEQSDTATVRDSLLEIERLLHRADLDDDRGQEFSEELDTLYSDVEQFLGEGAFRWHLTAYMNEQEQARASGDREEPLCTCGDRGCYLKRAKIPRDVRMPMELGTSKPYRELVAEWIDGHAGNAAVLIEAFETFQQERGRVIRAIDRLYVRVEAAAGEQADLQVR